MIYHVAELIATTRVIKNKSDLLAFRACCKDTRDCMDAHPLVMHLITQYKRREALNDALVHDKANMKWSTIDELEGCAIARNSIYGYVESAKPDLMRTMAGLKKLGDVIEAFWNAVDNGYPVPHTRAETEKLAKELGIYLFRYNYVPIAHKLLIHHPHMSSWKGAMQQMLKGEEEHKKRQQKLQDKMLLAACGELETKAREKREKQKEQRVKQAAGKKRRC